MNKIVNEAYNLTSNCSYVLNGEILLKGYPRAKANGIVNSIKQIKEKEAKGDRTVKELRDFTDEHNMTLEEAQELLYMHAWDIIPLEDYKKRIWNVKRRDRLSLLKQVLASSKIISVIDHRLVKTYEEALAYFTEQLELELEGSVLKSPDGIWKDGKPTHQVKMKIVFTGDLKIIGVNEGEVDTKYRGSLGSVTCRSEDGKLVTKVGGFSEKERFMIWAHPERYIGRILEVKCNGLSKSESKEEWSMMYANAYKPNKELIFRDDKATANTLDELIDIEEANKYGN
jgi:ATP-dependent DNA ligase